MNSRALRNFVLWIVLPVAVFCCLNVAILRVASQQAGWFYDVELDLEQGHLDSLFIGSSRVAAAIDLDAYESELERLQGDDIRVQTLARGNISLIHTVLALEELAEEHPGELRGTDLMFEIPGGLPPVFGTWKDTARGWDSEWAEVGKNPQLLARVLDRPHLIRFWQSPTEFEAKAAVTARWALKGLPFFDERERVREQIISTGEKLARKIVGRRATARQLDLNDAGGIRTDAEAVQQIQAAVVEEARRLALDTRPYGDWHDSLLPDVVRIAKEQGMELVFFRIPQSSLLERASTTPARLEDARHFRRLARGWDATVVEFPFPVDDEDFPDGLHLRRSESAPFSRALARAIPRDLANDS